MVESISDEKADDPHGSESHSSEVVHEGEDAAFGDTTHDSVSTEDLNTIRYVNPSMSAAEITSVIEEVSDAGGGMVIAEAGEYDPEAPIEMSDGVYFRGASKAGTVFRPTEGLEAVEGADFGRSVFHAEDVEDIEFSHMSIDGTTDLNADYCIEPFDCENISIHDIFATNVADDPIVIHRNSENFGVYFCETAGEFDTEQFGSNGIEVEEGARDGFVAFNHCFDREMGIEVKSRDPGRETRNVWVFGNYISGSESGGIALSGDDDGDETLWLESVHVFHNIIEDIGADGTGVAFRPREFVRNSTIENNIIRGCDHAVRAGWLGDVDNLSINANEMHDIDGDVIKLEGGAVYDVADNKFISGGDGFRIGIRLESSGVEAICEENKIYDTNISQAIRVDGGRVDARYNYYPEDNAEITDDADEGNILIGNQFDGINVADGKVDVVRGNIPTVPVNITQLDEFEGNWAYNDGTTGSEGYSYYDGADWVGVDTTAL